MTSLRFSLFLVFAVLLGTAPPAQATLITVEMTGEVLPNPGTPFGIAPAAGDPITASFTYDTTAPSGGPAGQATLYPGLTTPYTIEIDGVLITPFTNNWQMFVANDATFGDEVIFEHNSNGPGNIAVGGIEQPSAIFQFYLDDTTLNALTDDSLPSVFPPFSAWTLREGFFRDSITGAQINMVITSVAMPVVPGLSFWGIAALAGLFALGLLIAVPRLRPTP